MLFSLQACTCLYLTVAWNFSAQAATLRTLCERCTPAQRIVSAEARGLAFPGSFGSGTVWVADFPNEVIEKYYVFKEDSTLGADKAPQSDFDTLLINSGVAPEDVLEVHPSDLIDQVSVTAVHLALTAEETNQATLVIDTVNHVLRPIGSGRSAQKPDPTELTRAGALPAVGTFRVPASIASSAFDVIGNSSRGLQVGSMMSQNNSLLLNAVQTGSIVQAVFNLPINTNFAARFEFQDGSFGNWEIDHTGRLQANFETFEDSEGNIIPFQPSTVPGRTFSFRDGRESGNFRNAVDRLVLLGFQFRESSHGSSSCTFSCNGDSCTVTCALK